MDLTKFLTARLDEDEAAAKEAASPLRDVGWTALDHPDHGSIVVDSSADSVAVAKSDRSYDSAVAIHIARHDPARVLREVEIKWAILTRHSPVAEPGRGTRCGWCSDEFDVPWPCADALSLAAIYSDHPDYSAP